VGSSNTWHDVRFEGTAHQLKFGAGTWANRVFWGYESSQRLQFEAPSLYPSVVALTDEGEGNAFVRQTQTLQDRVPLLVVNNNTCRAYTNNAGSTTNGLDDNITSLAGVDLQRLGIDTFSRTSYRGIYKSGLIPIEIGEAIEIESDADVLRTFTQIFDVNRDLITNAGGGGTMLRVDGGQSWNSTYNYYTQGANVTRATAFPKSTTPKFIQVLICTGNATTGVPIRWLNAWFISARARTQQLAGVAVSDRLPCAADSPTLGFAKVGEMVNRPLGGNDFTCTFALDTTTTATRNAGATVIPVTTATGIATGHIVGLELDSGSTHWTSVVSVATNDVTITDSLPSTATSGARIVFNDWVAEKDISANRGDADVTLVVGVDEPVQRFMTSLSANRTITLSSTGAKKGDTFRIVRTGTGAFTLDVGGLKTIPAYTQATVDVMWGGSVWVLTGYAKIDYANLGTVFTNVQTGDSYYLYDKTEGAVQGYAIYSNEGTNNIRAQFYVDDTKSRVGLDWTYTTGGPPFMMSRAGIPYLTLNSTGVVFGSFV